MDQIQYPQLPFLTREMLSFGSEAKFELRVRHQGFALKEVKIRGLTRAGRIDILVTTASSVALTTQNFIIDDIPVMLSAIDRDGDINFGDVFVAVELVVNGDAVGQLMAGFVYAQAN